MYASLRAAMLLANGFTLQAEVHQLPLIISGAQLCGSTKICSLSWIP